MQHEDAPAAAGAGPLPALVFLHHGLGCAGTWRDFPDRLAERTGCGALVYSRFGSGASEPFGGALDVEFMRCEALTALPEILADRGIRDPILVGHSDGASIALIATGSGVVQPRGLAFLAPHVFVEGCTVETIAENKERFRSGDPAERLRRHHGENTESLFRRWTDVWLDPRFRAWNVESYLPEVTCPVLVVQGEDDEYRTLRQVDCPCTPSLGWRRSPGTS